MNKKMLNTLLNVLLVALVAFYLGRYFYMRPAFVNGAQIPEFSATLLGGEEMRLSQLRGDYVLLDFWGSWCGPCRAANPDLVALHEQFGGRGFHIVSIAIDRDEAAWQRAIQQDGLAWPYHIIDRTSSQRFFDGPLAKQFGVKSVPTTYLINPKGTIVGVNLEKDKLAALLADKLTK